jgi:hypothetical protein
LIVFRVSELSKLSKQNESPKTSAYKQQLFLIKHEIS